MNGCSAHRVVAGYAATGGHTDVSTLGLNDTVAAAYHRPKHKHTAHTHTNPGSEGGAFGNAFAAGVNISTFQTNAGAASIGSADGGSGNVNDSLDAPAYTVLNYIIKT